MLYWKSFFKLKDVHEVQYILSNSRRDTNICVSCCGYKEGGGNDFGWDIHWLDRTLQKLFTKHVDAVNIKSWNITFFRETKIFKFFGCACKFAKITTRLLAKQNSKILWAPLCCVEKKFFKMKVVNCKQWNTHYLTGKQLNNNIGCIMQYTSWQQQLGSNKQMICDKRWFVYGRMIFGVSYID